MVYQQQDEAGGVVCVSDNCIAVANGQDSGYVAMLNHLCCFTFWVVNATPSMKHAKDWDTPIYAVADDFGTLQPVPSPWENYYISTP